MSSYLFFQKSNNDKILKRIRELLESIVDSPYQDIGKPEGLKYKYSGYWSRRINKEHRLIYKIENNSCTVFSLNGHYE